MVTQLSRMCYPDHSISICKVLGQLVLHCGKYLLKQHVISSVISSFLTVFYVRPSDGN